MTTFAKWTHPTTGQVRVYVNNLPMQGHAKIWIERQAPDTFGDELSIRVNSQIHNRSEAANLVNDVERALTAAAGRRVKTWADLLTTINQ